MPSVWSLPPTGATIDGDGVLKLSDGRTFTFANVPGNGWGTGRLKKMTDAVQALIDNIVIVANMQIDDPDLAPALVGDTAYFLTKYGGRRFINADGDLTDRSTLVSFEYDGTDLIPTFTRVY